MDRTIGDLDRATVDELLSTTRAVRRRLDLDRPVPEGLIEECLELAIQAPTGSNSQGWRFLVVREPEKKLVIAEAYRKAWEPYVQQNRQGLASLPPEQAAQQSRVIESADYLARHLERVPVLVIPCVLGRLPEGAPAVAWCSLLASIFPAVWSFQLALRSRGLGSVLTTLHLMYENEVTEALNVPDTVTQACLVPVAYAKGGGFRPAGRRPARDLTYWDEWGLTRDKSRVDA